MFKLQLSQKSIAIGLAAIALIGLSAIAFTLPDTADSVDREIELTTNEFDNLEFLYEEEKLARDVYTFLNVEWNLATFSNIAGSEQSHINAVENLLDNYGTDGIIELLEPGQFHNVDLQILYDSLIEWGAQSATDALLVGASIEEIDILDIQEFMANATNTDVITVYKNLEKGSRNHLRAFTEQLAQLGVEYTPQYLTIEEFNEIIKST